MLLGLKILIFNIFWEVSEKLIIFVDIFWESPLNVKRMQRSGTEAIRTQIKPLKPKLNLTFLWIISKSQLVVLV